MNTYSRKKPRAYKGITILIVGLLVVGCCPRVIPSTTSSVKDSVVYRETIHEVRVRIPGDTVMVTEYIHCDSITNKPVPIAIDSHGKKSKVRVMIDAAGKLTATGGCDSLTEKVHVLQKENFHLRNHVQETVKIVMAYKTRRLDVLCRWIAGMGTLGLLIYLFIKLKF